jgi:hypothetical protein
MITSTNDVVNYKEAVVILCDAIDEAAQSNYDKCSDIITTYVAKLKAICYEVEEEV